MPRRKTDGGEIIRKRLFGKPTEPERIGKQSEFKIFNRNYNDTKYKNLVDNFLNYVILGSISYNKKFNRHVSKNPKLTEKNWILDNDVYYELDDYIRENWLSFIYWSEKIYNDEILNLKIIIQELQKSQGSESLQKPEESQGSDSLQPPEESSQDTVHQPSETQGGSKKKSLDKYTLSELKEKAKKRGMKVSGLSKKEIIAKLRKK